MRRLILEEPMSRAAAVSRRVAVFACLTAGAAMVVARATHGEDSLEALAVFAAALLLAGVALLLAGAAAVEIWNTGRRGVAQAAAGALLALALIGFPAYLTLEAARLPRINGSWRRDEGRSPETAITISPPVRKTGPEPVRQRKRTRRSVCPRFASNSRGSRP